MSSNPTLKVRHPDGTLHDLTASGTNPGFTELTEVSFVGGDDIDGDLYIDDALIPLSSEDGTKQWRWKPGFYAGEVRAEIVTQEGQCGAWRLDVSPDPTKLGQEIFHGMLADLLAYDEGLVIGREPARKRLGALGKGENPLVALARLRAHEGTIRRTLADITRNPLTTLQPRRQKVPLHAVRRADRASVLGVLRTPALAGALADHDVLDTYERTEDLRVDVPIVEREVDCAANRAILVMLSALIRRCLSIRDHLTAIVDSEKVSDTRSDLAIRWPRLETLLKRLYVDFLAVRRRHPFKTITRAEMTSAGLNAISADPTYARCYRSSWLALRQGIEGDEEQELLPLIPTWEVYERWCFVRLVKLLRQELSHLTWDEAQSHPTGAMRALVGASNRLTVELLLQPTFPGGKRIQSHDFWSISQQRIPDLLLTVREGDDKAFIILDAKYRVSRSNVLDAMSSAHIYQDSLRWAEQRPHKSLLMIPASGGAPWLEDVAFHNTHRVGVKVFSPEEGMAFHLRDLHPGLQ